jgi:tetratricopeptide (TPR) repeat protein
LDLGPWTLDLRALPRLLCFTALLLLALPAARGADAGAAFDAANKLYEQGKFAEAAAAYEQLLPSAPRSETLWFNAGNAWFKAGQPGRAIAAYRHAEQLAPRDPAVRFNLNFVRKKVSGSDSPAGPAWQRALGALTLNEWTVLASVAAWVWFVLLALREWRPALRPALSGYTVTTGAMMLLLIGCAAFAADLRFNTVSAVVIAPEAIVRSGPLEEAKVLHQFRDGIEVTVLDRKDLGAGDQKQAWLQVRDGANHSGWLKGDQVAVIGTGVNAR